MNLIMRNSTTIKDVILAPGGGGFFYDDQAAIREGVDHNGFLYVGAPRTSGFAAIRMPAASLSIGLVLADETVVWGDMMGVQYGGAGGREAVFDIDHIRAITENALVPRLVGADVAKFLVACDEILCDGNASRLPLPIKYGLSQALLCAAAHYHGMTPSEVVCLEFNLPLPERSIPLYAQSGDARELNVDKMILKSVDVLPHGLINSREKFGRNGGAFRQFVKWVVKRISEIGAPDYHPTLHFDVYGWIGMEIGLEPGKIAEFIARVADDASGYRIHIECPADYGSTDRQVEKYSEIVRMLDQRGSNARVVVDEQCNTLADIEKFAKAKAAHLVQIKMPDVGSIADSVRAVLMCKKGGVGAYLGGSCTETDLSARISAHVAVATQADMILAKPGMGVDEGLSIVGNEQNRLLSLLSYRRRR
ncbi:methylaspartate ammonia-lyase [Bradyrhizobium embrapense]|uniref:methylaspartate ammonia-lyase n=1 Tax=Bradyrhizobium embrapense TaxID=630921 RepID=UPI000AAB588E|nr:methylaspartate ammonia-lyase [Bradyrhizobium embrapense]